MSSKKKVIPSRIRIYYWASFNAFEDTQKYQHGEEIEFSNRKNPELSLTNKRNSIVSYFLNRGYAVMLKQFGDGETLTISVDTQKFGQR